MPKHETTAVVMVRLPSFEKGAGTTRCCMPMPTVSCIWRPTPATPGRWCRSTAIVEVWLNPPPVPLETPKKWTTVYGMPFARVPHPDYGDAKVPAWEMIRFSVNIMRGCFGGCTFCSITEHEGRIIQNRSARTPSCARSRTSATRCPASPA